MSYKPSGFRVVVLNACIVLVLRNTLLESHIFLQARTMVQKCKDKGVWARTGQFCDNLLHVTGDMLDGLG